jgi:hypothetical protein
MHCLHEVNVAPANSVGVVCQCRDIGLQACRHIGIA